MAGKDSLPKVTSSGTSTASQLSDKAVAAAGGLSNSGLVLKANPKIISGVPLGVDPKTGKPILPRDAAGNVTVLYPANSEVTFWKSLAPADRAKVQKELKALNLYPKNYNPSLNGIVTQEDYNAILKIQAYGEQKGLADENDVINLAKKDSKVRAFLTSGGYTTGTTLSTTRPEASAAELTASFLDLFNEKPTKAELKMYQDSIVKAEKKAKGSISQQEQENIFLSIANKRITEVTTKALAGDVKAQGQLDEGQLGKRVREIRKSYYDNGIPVSDAKIYSLAGKSLRDSAAYDNVKQQIQTNAITQWAPFADGIKMGMSVADQLQPYITVKSQIRGIPESQIKISDMTDVMNPDGTVKKVAAYKTEQYGSKEYLSSSAYKNTVLNDMTNVLQNFGVL